MADFDPHKIPYRFGMMDFLTAIFLVGTPTSVTMSLTDNGGAAAGIAVAALIFTAPGLIWGASIADVFDIKSAWKRALIQVGSFLGFVAVVLVIACPIALLSLLVHGHFALLLLVFISWCISVGLCWLMFKLDARRIEILRWRYKPDLSDGF